MDREDIIALLKEKLSISISDYSSFYEKGIKVELSFDDDVISEDTIALETSYDI